MTRGWGSPVRRMTGSQPAVAAAPDVLVVSVPHESVGGEPTMVSMRPRFRCLSFT